MDTRDFFIHKYLGHFVYKKLWKDGCIFVIAKITSKFVENVYKLKNFKTFKAWNVFHILCQLKNLMNLLKKKTPRNLKLESIQRKNDVGIESVPRGVLHNFMICQLMAFHSELELLFVSRFHVMKLATSWYQNRFIIFYNMVDETIPYCTIFFN